MRLSRKLQISRLAHPFKVSCLRADYTLVNFNNESHTYPREFRRGTVRRPGERQKQTFRALLARFEVITTKLTSKGFVLVTPSAIKHFLSACAFLLLGNARRS